MDNKTTIKTLNRLIESCKDGEYGFHSCAEQAESLHLREVFSQRAADCRNAAAELQALVRVNGGMAEEDGSVMGAVHRGWVAVRSKLSGYSDQAMLEECERGEDTAMERYRDAMQNEELPVDVRQVIERQYMGVKRNHLEIRTLRDQARAHA